MCITHVFCVNSDNLLCIDSGRSATTNTTTSVPCMYLIDRLFSLGSWLQVFDWQASTKSSLRIPTLTVWPTLPNNMHDPRRTLTITPPGLSMPGMRAQWLSVIRGQNKFPHRFFYFPCPETLCSLESTSTAKTIDLVSYCVVCVFCAYFCNVVYLCCVRALSIRVCVWCSLLVFMRPLCTQVTKELKLRQLFVLYSPRVNVRPITRIK